MKTDKPARGTRWWFGLLAVAACAFPAAAQVPSGGLGVYQEQLRVQMDQQSPEARQMAVDAGGWFNFACFTYDDAAVGKERTLCAYDLRVWASANVDNTHHLYVRGLTSYLDWNHNDNPFRGDDGFQDPTVERAWYEFDLAGLTRAEHKATDNDLRIKVGRDYMEMGTDLVMAMPLDMVQGTAKVGNWEWMAFLGQPLPDDINIDQSPLVREHDQRWFWGTQVSYTGFAQHKPFVYFLNNQDDQDRRTATQKYNYTSRYVGAGSTGNLVLPNLRYQTELAGEWGSTYSRGATRDTDDIEAWVYDANLAYYFQSPMHPKLMAEFLHASGDSDRQFSSTNTIGGNAPGTTDSAFNAFGYRDLGVALAPSISNLNAYVVGASFFPLEKIKIFRKLEVGTRLYWYQKDAYGAISDPTTTDNGRYIGWEGDLFMDWRITSDISWTIRYGGFVPGSTYGRGFQDCRNFLFTGITYSF
jgi:hypothetical protein